ncbi:MAG: DNA internalization-related competence protein ComEC/Rec2 [Azonexus sp.]|nr:DNA internalization-related competence protein ComEC/Rec2 [Azonexus sp.]
MNWGVVFFAVGVAGLQTSAVLPEVLPLAVLALCCLLPRAAGNGAWRRVLAGVGCFLLGLSWAAWRADLRLADALDADWEGRDVAVVGVVAGMPHAFAQGQRFDFAIERVLTADAKVPSRVQLAWYGGPPVWPGERWQFSVRLKRPHGSANPGGFDYEVWLLERGIRAGGYVRSGGFERLGEAIWPPAIWVARLRAAIGARFSAALPEDEWPWRGVLSALAIGDQSAVDGPLWAIFNRTGTTHLMAISGLHVTMVAGLFGWLVNALWRRFPVLALRCPAQKAGLLAAALAAFAYALLAGFGVPAQRTLYMLLVAVAARFSSREVAPSRVLALAMGIVLVIDPWAVLAAGFWLSFGAVAGLLLMGASSPAAGQGWRRRLRAWGMVQWAATLATLPILLMVFQQFSLVSPLANAVAVPVISFVVTPLALLAALIPWPPLLQAAHWVLDGLMPFLGWCASWPVWQAASPPWWAMAGAGLGVAMALLPRGVPGRSLGLMLVLPVLIWPAEWPPVGEAWIDVLDVGQGQAVVVRTRSQVLMFDPGPRYTADTDAGQRVLLPFLRWLGVDRVDVLIVTHDDADHAGGLASLLSALPVARVLSSAPLAGATDCADQGEWAVDGVAFALLHPRAGDRAGLSGNDLSCVLRIGVGGHRVLLTADIEAAAESQLLRRDTAGVQAEVLLAPHHGSGTSSTAPFIAAVNARDVLFSVGYRNRFGHPQAGVQARYAAQGARLWRTDSDGALHVVLRGDGADVSGWRQTRPRYWHGR